MLLLAKAVLLTGPAMFMGPDFLLMGLSGSATNFQNACSRDGYVVDVRGVKSGRYAGMAYGRLMWLHWW